MLIICSVSNLTHPKVNTMRLSSFLIFGSILPLICAADANGDPKSLRGLKEKSIPVASNADGTSNVKRNLQDCPNGYWDDSSSQCVCQSPDIWTGDACCPANSYFDWKYYQCACNSDYQWDGSACIATGNTCPPNGYWDDSSSQCLCQSWDVWTGDACCPANAYFDWTYYQCTCNYNYQWDGSTCIEIQTASGISPIDVCAGDGGACQCGQGGDGTLITLNSFWGDATDEQVYGCSGAFHLDGATFDGQYGGDLNGPLGLSDSFDGWEGCCNICGMNLQIAGKLSSGWYCEMDSSSTGIWLKHY
jgi:hypothetical protein